MRCVVLEAIKMRDVHAGTLSVLEPKHKQLASFSGLIFLVPREGLEPPT